MFTALVQVAQNWQTDDLIHCRLRAAGVRQATFPPSWHSSSPSCELGCFGSCVAGCAAAPVRDGPSEPSAQLDPGWRESTYQESDLCLVAVFDVDVGFMTWTGTSHICFL